MKILTLLRDSYIYACHNKGIGVGNVAVLASGKLASSELQTGCEVVMRSWRQAFVRKAEGIRNLFWLGARPKLVYDWYRMWGTLPVAHWLRAADCFIRKEFVAAALHYEKGLERNGKHPARHCARMDLAYCLYRNGEIERALQELRVVTESSVALRDAYLLRAKIEDILGRPEMAIRSLADGLALFPQDTRLLVGFIHICLFNDIEHPRLSEVRGVLLQQKRELLLDDNRQVLLDSALAHYELKIGDTESGDRMLVRVLATGMAPFEAIVIRGERLFEQRRMLQAREQLGRAMRLSPRNPRPARLLAESYLLPGDFCELDWAEQLAAVACKASAWQNPECIEIFARVMDSKGDASTTELLLERRDGLNRQIQLECQGSAQREAPVQAEKLVA